MKLITRALICIIKIIGDDIDIDSTSVELWKRKRALTETRDVADEGCYCGARKISSFNKFYFSIFSRLFQKSSLTLTRHF